MLVYAFARRGDDRPWVLAIGGFVVVRAIAWRHLFIYERRDEEQAE